MIQHVLINTIIFISIEQVVGLALMAGADGAVAHPAVNLARAGLGEDEASRVVCFVHNLASIRMVTFCV